MPSARKIAVVEKLSEKINRAKALVFTDYQGLTHKQLEGLKKALKTVEAEFVVTKNTLLKRAFEQAKGKWEMDTLERPTATLFAYADTISPLKELAKTIRLFKLPTVKFGLLDGKVYNAQDILKLSILPSADILMHQVVGGMKAPIYGLHRALNWNLQKLVLTLSAIKKSKVK